MAECNTCGGYLSIEDKIRLSMKCDANGNVVWQGALLNLSDTILAKLLFLGNYSDISDGKMPNKLTGSTDWLTVSGSVGSETYQCPNTAPYIAADTDLIWFNSSGVQRNVLSSDLVGYDLQRTPVKYSDNSPYNINSIAILKSGETLTTDELNELHTKFRLPLYWSGVLNENGVLKGNRGLSQSVWVIPPTGLTLSLISGGVKIDWLNDSANQTEIWGKSDDGAYTLLYTIAAGIVTKSETTNPVDLRFYKIRSKKGTAYSYYTLEVSIAMLGAEKVVNGTFTDSSGWNINNAGVSIDNGLLKFNAVATSGNYIYQTPPLTIGKTYKTSYTIVNYTSGSYRLHLGSGLGDYVSSATTKTQNITCAGGTYMQIRCVATATANIDNVSVKEILFP